MVSSSTRIKSHNLPSFGLTKNIQYFTFTVALFVRFCKREKLRMNNLKLHVVHITWTKAFRISCFHFIRSLPFCRMKLESKNYCFSNLLGLVNLTWWAVRWLKRSEIERMYLKNLYGCLKSFWSTLITASSTLGRNWREIFFCIQAFLKFVSIPMV